MRGPGQFNIDASLIKLTRFGRVETEFRIEAFNLLNHPQFVNPNGTQGNAAFGTISRDAVEPRLLAVRDDGAADSDWRKGEVLGRGGLR